VSAHFPAFRFVPAFSPRVNDLDRSRAVSVHTERLHASEVHRVGDRAQIERFAKDLGRVGLADGSTDSR